MTPKDQGLPKKLGQKGPTNPQSDSHHVFKPGVSKTPTRTANTDFKSLDPPTKARLKTSTPATTKEADIEDYRPKGIEFQIGAPKGKLGTAPTHYAGKGQRRDVLSATKNLRSVKD